MYRDNESGLRQRISELEQKLAKYENKKENSRVFEQHYSHTKYGNDTLGDKIGMVTIGIILLATTYGIVWVIAHIIGHLWGI